MEERLQKLIARAGVASRRTAEALIASGAVRVNGRVVTKLGSKADPDRDSVTVSGKRLQFPAGNVSYLFYKPRNTVCTARDPKNRRTIFSALGRLPVRVFPVGRLPYEADGLLLLTSDGEFADRLSRGRLKQTFTFKVKGRLEDAEIETLRRRAARHQKEPLGFRLTRRGPNPWYQATLIRPQSDWLRTLLFRSGHPVEKMTRVGLGGLRDARLRPGHFRELTRAEISGLLREAAGAPSSQPKRRARRKKIG